MLSTPPTPPRHSLCPTHPNLYSLRLLRKLNKNPKFVQEFLNCPTTPELKPSLECTQCHSIENNGFPSPSNYQLWIASWQRVELCAHFPLPTPRTCVTQTCAGLNCAVTISVSSYMHQLCSIWEKVASLKSFTTYRVININSRFAQVCITLFIALRFPPTLFSDLKISHKFTSVPISNQLQNCMSRCSLFHYQSLKFSYSIRGGH